MRSNTTRTSKRSYRNAYYNRTSEAYQYQDTEYIPYRRRKTGISTVPKRRERTSRKKVKYSYIKSVVKVKKLGFFIPLIAICFSAFTVVYENALITIKKENINTLCAELKNLQEKNSILKNESLENVNLEEIEQLAINLGMQKPAQHQIVYINVPKQAYTVQMNTKLDTEKSKFNITDFFKQIFKE